MIWKEKRCYSIKLIEDLKFNKHFLFGFARGLMDTDGYVESHGVGCSSTSKALIYDLKNIFETIGIKPTVRKLKKKQNEKTQHRIRIKKSDLIIYYKKIGFSNPRKQNSLIKILRQ